MMKMIGEIGICILKIDKKKAKRSMAGCKAIRLIINELKGD